MSTWRVVVLSRLGAHRNRLRLEATPAVSFLTCPNAMPTRPSASAGGITSAIRRDRREKWRKRQYWSRLGHPGRKQLLRSLRNLQNSLRSSSWRGFAGNSRTSFVRCSLRSFAGNSMMSVARSLPGNLYRSSARSRPGSDASPFSRCLLGSSLGSSWSSSYGSFPGSFPAGCDRRGFGRGCGGQVLSAGLSSDLTLARLRFFTSASKPRSVGR